MKNIKGKERPWTNVGIVLRSALLLGVCVGVISAKPGHPEHMTFSDVLNLLNEQSHRGGSGNRDASVDYLRYSGSVRVTCKSRGLCNCYSKAIRRSFCCDCLNGPCFPADATVTTPKGDVMMSDLAIGDTVLGGTETGRLVWTPVVAWLDRRPHEEAQYLSISTEGGPSLTLSSSHLLFTSNGNQLFSRFAGDVLENEALLMISDVEESPSSDRNVETTNITAISPVIKKGAYVPLTQTGTIYVNGILASCYASVTHEIAHNALAPVRWLPSWVTGGQYEGTMPYVGLLKWIASRVLPSCYLAPKDASVTVENFAAGEELPSSRFMDFFNNIFHMFVTSV